MTLGQLDALKIKRIKRDVISGDTTELEAMTGRFHPLEDLITRASRQIKICKGFYALRVERCGRNKSSFRYGRDQGL